MTQELKQELQARFAEIIANIDGPPPGERCQECGLCDAIGLFLPEKYAPEYSPSSFSPSELVARCVVCVERWQHNISKRTTKSPFRWL